jgi:hypothetical protein
MTATCCGSRRAAAGSSPVSTARHAQARRPHRRAAIAFDEYAAEHFIGFRFYRHRSLDPRQAVNHLLLWYLPPAPAGVEQAFALLSTKGVDL